MKIFNIVLGMTHKLRRSIAIFLRWAIVAVCIFYLYTQLSEPGSVVRLRFFMNAMTRQANLMFISGAFVLVFLNWGIESLKWKWLLRSIRHVSYGEAVKAVLSGVSVGIFTPNRIGEYAGRVLHLPVELRIKGVLANVFSGISQLLITVVAGSMCLAVYVYHYSGPSEGVRWMIVIACFFVCASVVFFYYNISGITHRMTRWRWMNHFRDYVKLYETYSQRDFTRLLVLSFFRYAVFTGQYYLVLRAVNVDVDVFSAVMMISVTFLVIAAIPTFALAEIGVRGSVSVHFMALLSQDTVAILAASFIVWIINLALPAFAGAMFLVRKGSEE